MNDNQQPEEDEDVEENDQSDDDQSSTRQQAIDPKIQACLNDSSKCYQRCILTMMYCLQMGEEHTDPKHIALLMDCAEICELTEHFILRQPESRERSFGLAQLCAKICEECAQNCEEMAEEDEQMRACAEMCRRCAESCKAMTTNNG